MTPIAFTGWSFIFIGILIVIVLGVIYGFFTMYGSGIGAHPSDGRDGAPGAEGRSEASGRDEGDGSDLSTHGTR